MRRPRSERKILAPEFEALARGEQQPFRHRRPRLRDTRTVALIPGVANRDARSVCDARTRELQFLLRRMSESAEQDESHYTSGLPTESLTNEVEGATNLDSDASLEADEASIELTKKLAEAAQLRLWRGRSVTSFESYAEAMLQLDSQHANELLAAGRQALSMEESAASDEAIAVAIRTEAAALESGLELRVQIQGSFGDERIVLDVHVSSASETLRAIGRRLTPLAADHERQTRNQD
ncbi:MAG: hypothetical protein AAF550_06030 [Myxococcota bacterium]